MSRLRKYQPKSGWKRLNNSAVFERDGVKVHLLGKVRFSNSTTISFLDWPYRVKFEQMRKIHGNNNKRACLAFADYLIGVL